VSAGSHRKPTSGGVGVSRGSGSIQLTREVDFPKPAATIGGQGAWIVQEVDAWFCHHEELRARAGCVAGIAGARVGRRRRRLVELPREDAAARTSANTDGVYARAPLAQETASDRRLAKQAVS
jgi:hypothetical protein